MFFHHALKLAFGDLFYVNLWAYLELPSVQYIWSLLSALYSRLENFHTPSVLTCHGLSKFGCIHPLDSVWIHPNFDKSKTTFMGRREYI
jgi:hypothetical protein